MQHLIELASDYDQRYGTPSRPTHPDALDRPLKSGVIYNVPRQYLVPTENQILSDHARSVDRVNRTMTNLQQGHPMPIVLKKDRKPYRDITVPLTVLLGAMLIPFAL